MKNRPVLVFEMHRTHGQQPTRVVTHERATFHGFGCDYEEFEAGPGNVSIAIVELPDGSVIMPRADRVQFLDVPEVSA